ncbi:hypothetical protein CR532_01800 [Candidatus Borreliella tachyglossi]|uniref:Uncharacterized protein n=1 Tax=Candidatus Borreliella tachyglossi TaxID=1964448 RepID=A0A2S1LY63_9SPIR|nr:DUF5312 family protein [Candidatus Borreliella tachyglossi]AWG43216.1 hypothetical protein CR532_01800 [Candidatus Borreliella tachyglossi]
MFNRELTPEQVRQKRLREVKSNLGRINNFFNASKIQALPQFAKFIYGFYKTFAPLKFFVQRYKNSNKIIQFVVEKYLNESQRRALDYIYSFSASDVVSFTPDVPKNLNNNLSYLFKNITQEQIKLIDETCGALDIFFELVSYPYYSIIKNFDNLLPEDDLAYKPRFSAVGCGLILDELKDFLECIYSVRDFAIWKNLYDILLEVYGDKGNFPIKPNIWLKMLTSIVEINKNKEILYLIRYVSGDPDYFPISNTKKSKPMARTFFNDLTKHVANEIEKIKVFQKNSKSKIIAEKLFPGVTPLSLDNYSERMNTKITSKIVSTAGYVYYELLGYLKTYAINFVKKDLNDIINILIIKGQWKVMEISRNMSNDMHSLISTYSSLIDFDNNLGDHGNYGNRINALLHRASVGDKSSEKLLLNIIADINKKAFVLLNEYYSRIYSMEQRLKDCLEDYMKSSSERELIYNWKELDTDLAKSYGNNVSFGSMIKNIVGNLSLFLRLMDLYLERKHTV